MRTSDDMPVPNITEEMWFAMRRICTAARQWRMHHPSRAKAELELAAAVDEALAREDARPIATQLDEAERAATMWRERAEQLRKAVP